MGSPDMQNLFANRGMILQAKAFHRAVFDGAPGLFEGAGQMGSESQSWLHWTSKCWGARHPKGHREGADMFLGKCLTVSFLKSLLISIGLVCSLDPRCLVVSICVAELFGNYLFPTCQVRVSRFYQSCFLSSFSSGTAGPQPRAPELGGHCQTLTAWDCECKTSRRMSDRMSEVRRDVR